MIVMKFGGSSVTNATRMLHVIDIIKRNIKFKPLVVVSAVGDTTDDLIEAGTKALRGEVCLNSLIDNHKNIAADLKLDHSQFSQLFSELQDLLRGVALLKELSPRAKDYLVSFGERLSARLLAAALTNSGIIAKAYDAWEAGLTTDSRFGNAEIRPESASAIADKFAKLDIEYSHTPVVTGFIAKDLEGNITTLGRGGSDLTACALGAAIGAEEVQVWKDVDGILTTNPKYVPTAKPVPLLSFDEASELAYFGANVLHPRALIPAMLKGVPVRVKNSYNFEHPGTVIYNQLGLGLVKAITCKRNLTLVDVVSLRMLGQQGFLSKLFQIFEKHELSVDMVATSEVSVSLTLDEGGLLDGLKEDLSTFAKVEVTTNKASINLIGDVKHSTELLERAFSAMRELGINIQMVSHGASKVQFGFIVNDNEAEKCVQTLHAAFFKEM